LEVTAGCNIFGSKRIRLMLKKIKALSNPVLFCSINGEQRII
jgi:hypothetical protein